MLFKPEDSKKTKFEIISIIEQEPQTETLLLQSKKQLPNIEKNKQIFFLTKQNFKFIDILEFCVNQMDCPDLYLMSYAIGSNAIAKILNLKRKEKLADIYAYISIRVLKNSKDAYELLVAQAKQVKLARIHAKVYVLKDKNRTLTIQASANCTDKNSNIEQYQISNSEDLANFNINFITAKINFYGLKRKNKT